MGVILSIAEFFEARLRMPQRETSLLPREIPPSKTSPWRGECTPAKFTRETGESRVFTFYAGQTSSLFFFVLVLLRSLVGVATRRDSGATSPLIGFTCFGACCWCTFQERCPVQTSSRSSGWIPPLTPLIWAPMTNLRLNHLYAPAITTSTVALLKGARPSHADLAAFCISTFSGRRVNVLYPWMYFEVSRFGTCLLSGLDRK
jgi:hypothetical protein